MDASEYEEYIFGMLFLKRLSDQFDTDRAVLRAEYERKGMKPDLLDNSAWGGEVPLAGLTTTVV